MKKSHVPVTTNQIKHRQLSESKELVLLASGWWCAGSFKKLQVKFMDENKKTRVITPINMSFVFFWASQASNQSLWTSTMSMATYLASIWGDSNKDLRGQEMSYLMCRNIPKPQETADSSDSAPCCPFLARKKWWFPILHGLNMYQNAILIPGRSSP